MSVQVKPIRWRLNKPILILLGLVANFLAIPHLVAEDILIRIVGSGESAKYLGPGQSTAETVQLKVGDKVTWQNEGNRNHTATSFDSTGVLNFDTGSIAHHNAVAPFNQSTPIEITMAMFERAGGTAGDAATIDYFCDFHGAMEGKLEIRESTNAATPASRIGQEVVAAGPIARIRRDITMLTQAELNAYRDAWRRIQTSGAFQSVAGYHG